MAMREEAEARAETSALRAETRAKALVDGHYRRMQKPTRPLSAVDLAPPLSRLEKTAREYLNKHLPSTDVFREAVSIRAYYKAERRGFGPGQEGFDWIEAEQELLDVPPFSG